MNTNPKEIVNGLWNESIDVGNGVEVYPLTLTHYMLLEKIKSYLITNEPQEDQIEILKSLYICTHSAKEAYASISNLEEAALEWGATIPPFMFGKINDAILEQIKRAMDLLPPPSSSSSEKKSQVATDGSPL